MKDILESEISEQSILNELHKFKCSKDPDVERFLKTSAIPFEKAHKSRTYLIIDHGTVQGDHFRILGYFSVAISNMKIKENVSKTMRKRLDGIFQNNLVPCYLIGQLGKNACFPSEIRGSELIGRAMQIIQIGHKMVGGRFIRIDSKMNHKLIKFYEENGFRLIQMDKKSRLLQFVRLL